MVCDRRENDGLCLSPVSRPDSLCGPMVVSYCTKIRSRLLRDYRTSPIRLSPIIGENPEGILAKVQWTSANWRKYSRYIGESSVDIRQLAKVQGVHWRISREWIGESRIELHEWRWHIHIVSNVQELCLTSVAQPGGRQVGNCPFHLEVYPSKFLSESSCPLKYYFFKIVFFNFSMREQSYFLSLV